MSELIPVTEDPGGAQPLDPSVDPAPQVPVQPQADAKPVSRRDAIAAALKDKQAAKAAPAAPIEAVSPTPDPRPRDPATGRFVNKDGSLAAPDPGAAAAAQPAISRKPMPKAWKQDYAPKWDAMDPELANFLAEQEERRERQVMEGVSQYKTRAQELEPIMQVIGPRAQSLAQQYGSAERGIETLFQLSDAASQNPLGFIQWFAQQRGIDLRSLVPQAQAQQPVIDPATGQPVAQQPAPQGQMPDLTQYLQQALQPVLQKTSAMERQLQQFTTAQSAAETSQREQAVNSFFSEADATGTVKFQIDDDAMDEFATQVQFQRATHPDWDYRRVLEQSYEALTWTNETLRTKRLNADRERSEKERKEREARELATKKAAAVSVKGAPGTSPAASIDPTNRRAVIERAVANLSR
ncbi:MAG: hypothetical protein NUV51_03875 [Sulfuricaulis sp.]|nr:hypothetical protein [Sulfuricaulis sp.]